MIEIIVQIYSVNVDTGRCVGEQCFSLENTYYGPQLQEMNFGAYNLVMR